MSPLSLFVLIAIALSAIMSGAWAIVARGAKNGWIDATWSFSVGLAGVVVALVPAEGWPSDPVRRWVLAGLAAVWSLRLGLHIVRRTMRGGDDPRYVMLKQEWGSAASSRLFWFLQIQAASALLLALTIFFAAHNPHPAMQMQDWIALAIFVVAVGGEAVADAQLARFSSDPSNKGRVCDVGLWRLSRHPNYFFEWLGWVAYAVIAIDPGGTYHAGWLALAGPIFMYWLLVHVSGIPPLEQHMLRSRGDAYLAYQSRVNAFWPGASGTARQSSTESPK